MTAQASRPIFRIPTYKVGPQVFMYNEVADQQPWSLIQQHIEPLWADTKGKGITVAVLDTGLWQHRDLPEPAFAANFSARDRSTINRAMVPTWLVRSARLNGAGVVGYAPECNIGAIKVLGDDGSGASDSIAKGIYYAAEQGAHIINMSLGGGYDAQIEKACRDVIQQGVFIICAAGNDGEHGGQNTIGWPARLPETLAIASYNEQGQISEFSSRGPEVDVAFPGEDILSTWPNDTFRRISGTSMATPAACGLTALMLSYQKSHPLAKPIKNNSDLRERWRQYAQDMGAPGKDNAFGFGIPDAAGVIRGGTSLPPVPGTPGTPGVPTVPGVPGGVVTPIGGGFTLLDLIRVVPAKLAEKQGLFITTV